MTKAELSTAITAGYLTMALPKFACLGKGYRCSYTHHREWVIATCGRSSQGLDFSILCLPGITPRIEFKALWSRCILFKSCLLVLGKEKSIVLFSIDIQIL